MKLRKTVNRTRRKGDLIKVNLGQRQTPRLLAELRQEIESCVKDQGQCNILVDATKSKLVNLRTKQSAAEFLVSLPSCRFAVFGAAPPINLSLKYLIEETKGGERIKIFRHQKDAIAWLDGQPSPLEQTSPHFVSVNNLL